ncbi:unnamed protein product [Cercopithifilaria johnstoni]|uniref:Uncharacterized protein n=1 Tax=Cercopithifilaria johnstoni TaxID=2874296 RepID=A0A8J2Q3E8_9BILA|nr:unnamed protein product [Cercopithifilaria johnstoni]
MKIFLRITERLFAVRMATARTSADFELSSLVTLSLVILTSLGGRYRSLRLFDSRVVRLWCALMEGRPDHPVIVISRVSATRCMLHCVAVALRVVKNRRCGWVGCIIVWDF